MRGAGREREGKSESKQYYSPSDVFVRTDAHFCTVLHPEVGRKICLVPGP